MTITTVYADIEIEGYEIELDLDNVDTGDMIDHITSELGDEALLEAVDSSELVHYAASNWANETLEAIGIDAALEYFGIANVATHEDVLKWHRSTLHSVTKRHVESCTDEQRAEIRATLDMVEGKGPESFNTLDATIDLMTNPKFNKRQFAAVVADTHDVLQIMGYLLQAHMERAVKVALAERDRAHETIDKEIEG